MGTGAAARGIAIALAGALASPGACAQTPALAPDRVTAGTAATIVAADQPGAEGPDAGSPFLRDVAHDYLAFLSAETARWLAVGGTAALGVHAADIALRGAADPATGSGRLSGGQEYGALFVQIPLAAGLWIAGAAEGNARAAATGRDLLRAQISAVSWTYAVKLPVDRRRPNGEPRSFPSGHASSTFATAMVLQAHYGWKAGLPAFAAAAYTAASRVSDDKHWASDVVFGAALGMASARTVTVRLRRTSVSVALEPVPGGAGVLLQVTR